MKKVWLMIALCAIGCGSSTAESASTTTSSSASSRQGTASPDSTNQGFSEPITSDDVDELLLHGGDKTVPSSLNRGAVQITS